MRAFLIAVSCLLLGFTAVAGAQNGAERKSKTQVKAARATPVGRTLLPNGLVLLVKEAPAEDMVALEVLIKVGIMDEKTPVAGITLVIMNLLENRINDHEGFEETASMLETSTEPDYARISVLTTAEHLPVALEAIGKAVGKRQVEQDELDKVVKKALNSLENGRSAFSQLYDIFRRGFYRYHPYRRSDAGQKLSLERLSPKSVDEYFNRYFVPNRMVFAASGRVDRLKIVEKLRDAFGQLEPGFDKWVEIPWEAEPSEKRVNLRTSADIAWIFIGYPAPSVASRDYVTMAVINAILGQGLSSRLFNEIREKEGLAYEVGSTYPVLRGPSHFLAYVITRPNDVGKSRRLLLREVERIKDYRVGPLELQDAKRKVMGKYLLDRETNRDRAHLLAVAETIGLGYEYDEAFLRELEKVTSEDVQRVAREFLREPTLIVARPGGRLYWDY